MPAHIAIVDPQTNNRIILKAQLSSAGHDVSTFEAIPSDFPSNRADLLVLGPGNSIDQGEGTVAAVAGVARRTRAISILLLSTSQDPMFRLKALRAGVDDVESYPFDEANLRGRVRNILRARSRDREATERLAAMAQLGFAEARQGFVSKPKVLSIGRPFGHLLDRPISAAGGSDYALQTISPDAMFKHIETLTSGPDVVILPSEGTKAYDGPSCIAELRARSMTRQTALLFAHAPKEHALAHRAMDIGANDIVSTNSTLDEVEFRITRLLDQKRKSDGLSKLLDQGLHLAVTDPLTGLYNRRYAVSYLDRLQARSLEMRQSYAAMVLDLDWFKHVNDRFGHLAGDAVLVEVASRLRANLRAEDLLARIGGEEFLVVIPNTTLDTARATAERLRNVVSESPIVHLGISKSIRVTISVGLSISGPDDGSATMDIIRAADRALLIAKSQGRNAVETWSSAA
jgi:two-component system cell cycle response regulator